MTSSEGEPCEGRRTRPISDAHVSSGAVWQRAGSAGLPRCLQLLLKKTGSEDAAVKFAWWYVDTCTGRTTASEAWGSAPVSIKRST